MRTNYWAKFEEHKFYHIYNRGINKEEIYKSEDNYLFFLRKWKELILPYFDILAYCLINNHFHFLVKVKPILVSTVSSARKEVTSKALRFLEGIIQYNDFLEDQFKRMFTSYALAFNKQRGRTGSLFQKRFKRILIKDEAKLLYLLIYIHHNPIHHNLVDNFADWKFSSFNAFMNDAKSDINRKVVFDLIDPNDYQNAKRLFKEYHVNFKFEKKMELLRLE